jgi:hypothetical protein
MYYYYQHYERGEIGCPSVAVDGLGFLILVRDLGWSSANEGSEAAISSNRKAMERQTSILYHCCNQPSHAFTASPATPM